jgi:hypothetical protein
LKEPALIAAGLSCKYGASDASAQQLLGLLLLPLLLLKLLQGVIQQGVLLLLLKVPEGAIRVLQPWELLVACVAPQA